MDFPSGEGEVNPKSNRFLTTRLDVINKCNLRCRMCHSAADEFRSVPRMEMDLELFHRVAAQVFPLCEKLFLSAAFEPLLARDFPRMLECTGSHRIPFTCYITNGTLLTEEIVEQTIAAGINEVVVSLDGTTAETYESIRRGARLARGYCRAHHA